MGLETLIQQQQYLIDLIKSEGFKMFIMFWQIFSLETHSNQSFPCGDSGNTMVKQSQVCDFKPDCPNSNDELRCGECLLHVMSCLLYFVFFSHKFC